MIWLYAVAFIWCCCVFFYGYGVEYPRVASCKYRKADTSINFCSQNVDCICCDLMKVKLGCCCVEMLGIQGRCCLRICPTYLTLWTFNYYCIFLIPFIIINPTLIKSTSPIKSLLILAHTNPILQIIYISLFNFMKKYVKMGYIQKLLTFLIDL